MPSQFPPASFPTFAFQSPCTRRVFIFSVSDQCHSVAGHIIFLFCCHRSLTLGPTLVLVYCDVERDRPQADGDEPAGDWVTFHDSVHDVFVNKKFNAMLMYALFH